LVEDADDARPGSEPSSPTAQLHAEIQRLKNDLIAAEWKIAELESLADIDSLLGLVNRRGFERELTRSLAYVKRYGTAAALMFMDLDGFKAVNDRHGHLAGDILLKAVAKELLANVRASDVVARLGGDEFGVLMWNVAEPQAEAKARELENTIERIALAYGEAQLSVGASAGIVSLLAGDATPSALIDTVDKAMYARKKERLALRARGSR
jgi:diguanylate cyclase (GGDEF)-like protein